MRSAFLESEAGFKPWCLVLRTQGGAAAGVQGRGQERTLPLPLSTRRQRAGATAVHWHLKHQWRCSCWPAQQQCCDFSFKVSTRILSRCRAPFPQFLVHNRVPHGFTTLSTISSLPPLSFENISSPITFDLMDSACCDWQRRSNRGI